MRAARAMLGIDQRELAGLSGLSLPTIQRMEASDGVVRGNVDSLMKLVGALAGSRHRADCRGRGQQPGWPRRASDRCRPRRDVRVASRMIALTLTCIVLLLCLAVAGAFACVVAVRPEHRLWRQPCHFGCFAAGGAALARRRAIGRDPAARPALDRRAFPARSARRLLPGRGRAGQRRRQPLRARLRPARTRTATRAAVLSGLPRRR